MAHRSTKPPASTKDSLRERFREYRTSLSESEYERLSLAVTENVIELPELQHARTVHVYWPILEQREVDTRPLIRMLRARGCEIVLPVVLTFRSTPDGTQRLAHIRYPEEEALRVNRWGIAEPHPGQRVPIHEIDAVIVPALGAGRNGHRIGHGLGYYDEFLSEVSAVKVCLIYSSCLADWVPFERHDVPVDVLVSESSVIRP